MKTALTRTAGAVLGAVLAVALAGCATTRQEDPLAQARATYEEVRADPQVTRFAPKELAQAGSVLNRAEALAREGGAGERVAHEGYLAERAALIARETALARAARAEVARADQERERILAEARAQAARAEPQEPRQAERATLAEEIERLQADLDNLEARQSDRGIVLALSGEVLFDVGRATLKPGAERPIGQLAELMHERPGLEIVIEGHTDSTGSEETNERLSTERAQAVRRALIERGVEGWRVSARGMGDASPVATNDTPAGRQLNRRVEVLIPQEGASQSAVGAPR